jgi:hypothetical protein
VLGEVMHPEELQKMLLLMCNIEHNHANTSWGGAWAAHTITCLLQDILEGTDTKLRNNAIIYLFGYGYAGS